MLRCGSPALFGSGRIDGIGWYSLNMIAVYKIGDRDIVKIRLCHVVKFAPHGDGLTGAFSFTWLLAAFEARDGGEVSFCQAKDFTNGTVLRRFAQSISAAFSMNTFYQIVF